MTKPKISIIVPIYNVENFLHRCLDSVLNQTFKDWQAILIDDGSPDKSGIIADEYASRDKRFVVVHKRNGGVSSARNVGLKHANGDYIMFLDADDALHHQAMDIVYNLAKNNNADIVSFAHHKDLYKQVLMGQDANKLFNFYNSKNYNLKKIKCVKTDNLINYSTERNHSFIGWKICHCYPVVHLYKHDLLRDITFDENIKISEDFPFWAAVLLRNPHAIILKTPLYFYIPNVKSALFSADSIKVFNNITLAVEKSFDTVKSFGATDKWMKSWNREFLWPFIIIFMRSVRNANDKTDIAKRLIELKKQGIFDKPTTMRARKYKRRIEKIISLIS